MNKGKKWKRILAWLLVLTMLWQSAGAEVLAAADVLTETAGEEQEADVSEAVSENETAEGEQQDAANARTDETEALPSDTGTDTGADAGTDTGTDAGEDTGTDIGTNTGTDAGDASAAGDGAEAVSPEEADSEEIEIQPVIGGAEQEAELYYTTAEEAEGCYWTAGRRDGADQYQYLTSGGLTEDGNEVFAEAFESFDAAAEAVTAYAGGNGEDTIATDKYYITYHYRRSAYETPVIGSLPEDAPEGLSLEVGWSEIMEDDGSSDDETYRQKGFQIASGAQTIDYTINKSIPLTLSGESRVQIHIPECEWSLEVNYPETEGTAESLVIVYDDEEELELKLTVSNASGADEVEFQGNIILENDGQWGRVLEVPTVRVSNDGTEGQKFTNNCTLKADRLEVDGYFWNYWQMAVKVAATMTDVSTLELNYSDAELGSLTVTKTEDGDGTADIYLDGNSRLILSDVTLEEDTSVCLRKYERTNGRDLELVDFEIGNIVASVPAEQAQDLASCLSLGVDWQRLEAEPAEDGTYNLVIRGMNGDDPLWVWQEPLNENDSRIPVGSASTFADAKTLIREWAERCEEEQQEKLIFTIDVNQPGLKLTGDALDYSAEKYGVSIVVSQEMGDRTLRASGTVTLGGDLYIQGDISGANAVVQTEVDENGDSPCVHIAGRLTLTGTLALNGEMVADTLSVTGTTTASAQAGLHIRKSGTLGSLTVKGDGNAFENRDSFRIHLAKADEQLAALTIKGNVTKSGSMEYPVTFIQEAGHWDDDGNFVNDGDQTDFSVGEVLAVLTKAESYVPTAYFHVDNDAQCVVRSGNNLVVGGTAVRVSYGELSRNYDSLSAAAKGIAASVSQGGFGSQKGEYNIEILQNSILEANVTIPACVTYLNLYAGVDLEDENAQPVRLDLNGKTLTANGALGIWIGNGLTIANGNLTANAATEIHADAVVIPELTETEAVLFSLPIENLTVTAANAEFYLNTALTREYSDEDFTAMEDISLTLDFDGQDGRTSLNVKRFGLGESFFRTSVRLNSLALNAGESLVEGYDLDLNTLNMKASRLYIGKGAELTVTGTATVSSAYPRDTGSRYHTIENDGGFVEINTLNMPAGTLYNGPWYQENGDNIAYMSIDTVKRVAKLYNEYDAVFRTHSYTQTASDKTYLFGQSEFFIEDDEEDGTLPPGSAVIWNLILEGDSSIRKSSKAALSISGTPVYNGSSNGQCTVRVVTEEGKGLADGDSLFSTSISSNFPVEMFRVADESDWILGGTEEQEEFLLYQSGEQIFISRARFVVFKEGVDDSKYLGSFATWAQASACITAMNDASADYCIEVNPDETGIINIGGSFILPSKAKSIFFNYTDENEFEQNTYKAADGTVYTKDFCTLVYTGSLNLTTNVVFHNFLLKPQLSSKNPAPSAVTLNAKALDMWCSGGVFSSITGKSGSSLYVTADPFAYGGELRVTGNVSGVTNLELSGAWASESESGTLTAAGAVSATNLELNHGYYEVSEDEWEGLEGKLNEDDLLDTGEAHLDAGGKVTLTNVTIGGEDNRISYGGNAASNILNITGVVSSDDDSIAYNGETCLYYKTNAVTVTPKTLNGDYDGQKLLQAAKAPSVWFVTEGSDNAKTYTTKSGNYIYGKAAGAAGPAVRLERDTEDGEDWETYSYYGTVKEAFAAIGALNDKTRSYRTILIDAEAETTKITENLTFPSKAAHLFIGIEGSGAEGEEFYYNFKNALTINCNTEFDGVVLYTPGGSISLGAYELTFTNCGMQGADENGLGGAKITGISGNASKAALILDNTFLAIDGNVKNLKTLELKEYVPESDSEASETPAINLWASGSISGIGTLVMGREALPEGEQLSAFVGAKTISVTNIETCHDNCEIAAGVTLTRNKSTQEITKMAPGLTISGTVTGHPVTVTPIEIVDGDLYPVLFYDDESGERTYEYKDENGNPCTGTYKYPVYIWGSAYKTNLSAEGENPSYEYKGIYLANAKKVSADMIRLNVANTRTDADSENPVGMLYKSGGYITYMSTEDYAVRLLYTEDGSDVSTPCITFADAVTEINNLSTARDYTIELQKDIGAAGDVKTAPVKLTLPSKGKAAMLTITSAASDDASSPYTIYYQGSITANTGLKLENVKLAQKVSTTVNKEKVWYLPGDIAGYYSAGVTLKTAYELIIGKGVEFDENTPVLLDGSNYAGTLTIAGGVQALVQKVTNFKDVNVDGTLEVSKYPTSYNSKTGVYKYAGGTMSARTVTLTNTVLSELGSAKYILAAEDTLNVTSELTVNGAASHTNISVRAGKITVKNLTMTADDSTADEESGSMTHCEITSDSSMTVSGTVSNTGRGNVLATYRTAAASAPTLTISGIVTLLNGSEEADASNRIVVKVNGPSEDGEAEPLPLDSASKLLTAPKAAAGQFEADASCLKEGNTGLYQWTESSADDGTQETAEKTGYILQKIGNYVNVYYADEIVAAAYKGEKRDGDLSSAGGILGYYISFADAVAAINSQSDKTSDYTIVLLNDVGGIAAGDKPDKPVSLTLPTTKAWVYVVSEKGQEHTIYYTNNISLKSHLELSRVKLAPQKLANKVYQPTALDIATGAYGLRLLCDMAEGCSVKNLTGTGYVPDDGSPVYVIGGGAGNLSGKLQLTKGAVQIESSADIAGLVNVQELIVGDGAAVSCAGSLTVKTLNYAANAGSIEGKAAMNIGDIIAEHYDESTWGLKIYTHRTAKNLSQLTITGKVVSGKWEVIRVIVCGSGAGTEEDNWIKTGDYKLSYPESGYQVQIPATKKLADVKKEYLSYFIFGDGSPVVKYNGGVYYYDTADDNKQLMTSIVKLEGKQNEDLRGYEYSDCLDLSQAAAEIKNLAEPETDYRVQISEYGNGNVVDTNVTDKTLYSAFTLPAANTCRSVEYYFDGGSDRQEPVAFLASSGLKPAGQVTFSDLLLEPVNAGGTAAAVNIAMSRSNASTENPSALKLNNCRMADGAAFNSISGVKNVSVLGLDRTDLCIKGNVTNLNVLDIGGSHLITLGTVAVNTVNVNETDPMNANALALEDDISGQNAEETAGAVQWDAYGAVTIAVSLVSESGMKNDSSYIAANRTTKDPTKPSFVLNGSVWIKDLTYNPKFRFKVYRYKTAGTAAVTSAEVLAGGSSIYLDQYKDEPLLIAPKADADWFIADFKVDSDGMLEGISSFNQIAYYKDLNYSVLNGDISDMAVHIIRFEEEETRETYAKSFAQAVAIIDKAADLTASYDMELLKADEEETGHIKTAQSGGKAVYGAMTLPTKAKDVYIYSESSDSEFTLAYTGKLTPRCDIEFFDVKLAEGSVDSKKNWNEAKEHAPTVDMGSGKYKLDLPGNEGIGYTSITAKSGEVVIWDDTTVSGAVNVKNLTLRSENQESKTELEVLGALTVSGDLTAFGYGSRLIGARTMTLTNIIPCIDDESGNGDPSIELVTYRTALTKTNKVSKTQLTINGQVEADTDIRMMVYDADAKDAYGNTYRPVSSEDEDIFLLPENAVPTDAAKIAVMPKASLAHVKVSIGTSEEDKEPLKWKYAKGLYLTGADYLPIEVTASLSPAEDGEAELVYEASFMTWAQAVSEIETINNSARDYTITLYESIGNNASIGTLTMPAKAKSLTVTSSDDSTENGRGIFFTGTTITLKCPTEFERLALVAVKKKTSGKLTWYDSVSYKIAAGSYDLGMKDMLGGAVYMYGTDENSDWLEALPGAIAGNAKAAFTYEQTNIRYLGDSEGEYSGDLQFDMASQVTGFGTFTVKRNTDDGIRGTAQLYISSGISGITFLNVDSDVLLCVPKGNISVKDARIEGTAAARNFTSTGTLTMKKGYIDVCDYVKNTVTGAVKLNNLVLESVDNQINGRLNKSNQSQIVISGTVSVAEGDDYDGSECDFIVEHAPVVVGLTYYTREGYVQLYDGMMLLQSAKTAASDADVNALFAPKYSGRGEWDDKNEQWTTEPVDGMGQKPESDEYFYKLVKSGKSNIVFQRASAG